MSSIVFTKSCWKSDHESAFLIMALSTSINITNSIGDNGSPLVQPSSVTNPHTHGTIDHESGVLAVESYVDVQSSHLLENPRSSYGNSTRSRLIEFARPARTPCLCFVVLRDQDTTLVLKGMNKTLSSWLGCGRTLSEHPPH
jgi:hypothetical protein